MSAAEQRLVRAVMRGSTNREIAASLGQREQTVKNRLSHVYRKIGVRNRVELAMRASACSRGRDDSS